MPEYDFTTPKNIERAYLTGYVGAYHDVEDVDRLLGELRHPLFGAAADVSGITGTGAGKRALPYLSYLKLDAGAFSEKQTTGSCVSHATRNACDLTRAIEIEIKRQAESFVARGANEAIYGSRGHSGGGMSCSGAARFVSQNGGILVRKKYDSVDLSVLNDSVGARWGGRGVPAEVLAEARRHQIRTVSQIMNADEAMDAIANGYGISTCGDEAWSSRRNEKGISELSRGSWSHAITIIGYDDTKALADETLFVMANSWGSWNGGGHPPWGQLPVGCWLARASSLRRRLGGRGSYAFSDFDGFPGKKVPKYVIF